MNREVVLVTDMPFVFLLIGITPELTAVHTREQLQWRGWSGNMDITGQTGVSVVGTWSLVGTGLTHSAAGVYVTTCRGLPGGPGLSQQTPLCQKYDYSNPFASPMAK